MAIELLRLPISRSSVALAFFSQSKNGRHSVKWFDAHLHSCPLRTFAAARSEKVKLPKKKRRLDEVCLERFQQYSRTFIQSWILQGKVFVDGRMVNKAGTQVSDKAAVEIMAEVPKYVCRAGHKLEAAIEQLDVDVSGKVALDSGLSTGGFTDCLLRYGASFVYGVDVGYGQVADKIRRDDRVSVIERTNLRYLSGLPQKVDLVTLDLSFISILLVMPAVVNVMKNEATLITLVKPQFEARRSQVGGGGIVRDPSVHQEIFNRQAAEITKSSTLLLIDCRIHKCSIYNSLQSVHDFSLNMVGLCWYCRYIRILLHGSGGTDCCEENSANNDKKKSYPSHQAWNLRSSLRPL